MGKAARYQSSSRSVAGGGSRPGYRSFSDTLEDFALSDGGPVAGTEQADEAEPEEELPPSEPSVTLHPDELERMRAQSHKAGYQAGEQAAKQALAAQMAGAVGEVLHFMEGEEARRNEQLARLSDLFVEGLCKVVAEIFAGDLSHTRLRQDLAGEAAALARQCKSTLALHCGAEDVPALKAALAGLDNVSLNVDEQRAVGHITLQGEAGRITLDQARWTAKLRLHVDEAIKALTGPASPGSSPSPRDAPASAEQTGAGQARHIEQRTEHTEQQTD